MAFVESCCTARGLQAGIIWTDLNGRSPMDSSGPRFSPTVCPVSFQWLLLKNMNMCHCRSHPSIIITFYSSINMNYSSLLKAQWFILVFIVNKKLCGMWKIIKPSGRFKRKKEDGYTLNMTNCSEELQQLQIGWIRRDKVCIIILPIYSNAPDRKPEERTVSTFITDLFK